MIIFLFSFFLVKIRGIVEILIDNGVKKMYSTIIRSSNRIGKIMKSNSNRSRLSREWSIGIGRYVRITCIEGNDFNSEIKP